MIAEGGVSPLAPLIAPVVKTICSICCTLWSRSALISIAEGEAIGQSTAPRSSPQSNTIPELLRSFWLKRWGVFFDRAVMVFIANTYIKIKTFLKYIQITGNCNLIQLFFRSSPWHFRRKWYISVWCVVL